MVVVQHPPQVRAVLVVLVVAVQAQGTQLILALVLVEHQGKVMLAGLDYKPPIKLVVAVAVLELKGYLALLIKAEMVVQALQVPLAEQLLLMLVVAEAVLTPAPAEMAVLVGVVLELQPQREALELSTQAGAVVAQLEEAQAWAAQAVAVS